MIGMAWLRRVVTRRRERARGGKMKVDKRGKRGKEGKRGREGEGER